MVRILLANVSTWIIYRLVKNDFAIIITDSNIMGLSLIMLAFRFSFKKYLS
jgi:hypothetical protein